MIPAVANHIMTRATLILRLFCVALLLITFRGTLGGIIAVAQQLDRVTAERLAQIQR